MPKVIVIGIDGLEPSLINEYMAQGWAPHLAELCRDGFAGTMESTIPPMSPLAWTSIITGAPPEAHGIFDFVEVAAGFRDFPLVLGSNRRLPPLWQLLGKEKKSVVVNVPYTYPLEPFAGLGIAGSFVPSAARQGIFYPAALQKVIEDKFGPYRVAPDISGSPANRQRFFSTVMKHLEQKMAVSEFLLKHYDWQLFFMTIFDNDRLGHECWDRITAADDNDYRRFYREYIGSIDKMIGRYRELAGPDTNILIISDHGMGPVTGHIDLNYWLLEQGYIQLKETALTRLRARLFRQGWCPGRNHRLLEKLRLASYLEFLFRDRKGGGLRQRLFLSFNDVDWRRTRAFSISRQVGRIFLNMGEPAIGQSARPGYRELCRELKEKLAALREPQSGRPLVGEVILREERAAGQAAAQAPDLLALPADWNDYFFGLFAFAWNSLWSPSYRKKGQHRPRGFIGGAGPGLCRSDDPVRAAVTEIAPAVLTLLGERPPAYMTAQPPFLAGRPETNDATAEAPPVAAAPAAALTAADREDVLSQLSRLGYY